MWPIHRGSTCNIIITTIIIIIVTVIIVTCSWDPETYCNRVTTGNYDSFIQVVLDLHFFPHVTWETPAIHGHADTCVSVNNNNNNKRGGGGRKKREEKNKVKFLSYQRLKDNPASLPMYLPPPPPPPPPKKKEKRNNNNNKSTNRKKGALNGGRGGGGTLHLRKRNTNERKSWVIMRST